MKVPGAIYKLPVKVLKLGKGGVPKAIEIDGQVYTLKGGYVKK